VLEIHARQRGQRTDRLRSFRHRAIAAGHKINDRRKGRAIGQVLEPFETPRVLHLVVEQHDVIGGAGESRGAGVPRVAGSYSAGNASRHSSVT